MVLCRCVIAELFTEGTSPFDLSQLLAYRSGEYSPAKLFQSIDDINIRVSCCSFILATVNMPRNSLWSPYVIGQTIIFMVALCNRADHYIFMLWFVLSFFFLFFFLA